MVDVERLRLDNREELEEAWGNLDLLPSAVAAEIDWLRRELLMMDEMLEDLPAQTPAMEFAIPGEYHGGYHQACIELRSHLHTAIDAINRAIISLKNILTCTIGCMSAASGDGMQLRRLR